MIRCDLKRLNSDPAYYDTIVKQYAGTHYVDIHNHTCKTCGHVITHTKLEALRDGDLENHTCCGIDVRKTVTD